MKSQELRAESVFTGVNVMSLHDVPGIKHGAGSIFPGDTDEKRGKRKMKKILCVSFLLMMLLAGCKADRVNMNIRNDADNFKVRRRVVAINTRTNEALFEVEGLISIHSDSDGDLNVTIQTGKNEYKLFYAHLSDDVTYTAIQLEPIETTPYAYVISFFPPKEVLEHGLLFDFEVLE